MKKILLGLVTMLSFVLAVSAQDSLNVTRLSTIRLDWGSIKCVDVVNSLIYMCVGDDSLLVWNAADLANPVEIGSCAADGDRMCIFGNFVFLANGNGLTIVDISTPSMPGVVGTYTNTIHATRILDIKVIGNRTFVVREENGIEYNHLYVYDTINPASPTLVGQRNCGLLAGVTAFGGYIYLAECDMGFTVCSIDSPFVSVGSYGLQAMDVEIAGGYAYLSCFDNFCTMSLEDPLHPDIVGTLAIPEYYAQRLAITEDLAFVSAWTEGLRVISIGDPANPVETGFYNTLWAPVGIAVQGHNAFVVEHLAPENNILVIYDCSAALSTQENPILHPSSFSLSCYPNPFNPNTRIAYELKKAGFVSMNVYNLLGQRVASLVNTNLAVGQHSVTFDGQNLPSGLYICKMEANGFMDQHKFMLIK